MFSRFRCTSLWVVLILLLVVLIARLVDLTIWRRVFLQHQSQARILRTETIPATRGIIYDRLGVPLAISVTASSAWIDPYLFHPTTAQLHQLKRKSHQWSAHFWSKVARHKKHGFMYLKRALSPVDADAIKALQIPGVYFQTEYRRYYPEGSQTAHVVGFTNIDGKGQEGMELAYDHWLRGYPGGRQVLKDRQGHVITEVGITRRPVTGKNIQLSVDHRIQYLAHASLEDAVHHFHAQSGSAVVVDVATGEILAMANAPTYNPNDRRYKQPGVVRNRAATDVFEPGSVIKPFAIALALQSGKYTPNTKIDTHSGWMEIGGYKIRDDLNYGTVTLTQLLQKSSNIAAAKIILSLDPRRYCALLRRVGFASRTQSGFPGEASGYISPQTTWVPSAVATLAYGYGLTTTVLQLAAGYGVLAAGGVMHPLALLKQNPADVVSKRVLSQSVAKQVVTMLKAVIERGGTGTRARVPGYVVAGKTGTAYVANAHGYDHKNYTASFVGMAPADHPKLVVAVVIQRPHGKHFGAVVAAPVFARIMSGALRIQGVAPTSTTAQARRHSA